MATDYWLGHCEGFRLDSREGRLGFVEQVVFGSRLDRPDALIVRAGLLGRQLLLVPVEEVESIRPRDLRVVLRPSWRPSQRDFLSELLSRLRSLADEAFGGRTQPRMARVPVKRERG